MAPSDLFGALDALPGGSWGVAVSGGSDSMALLALAHARLGADRLRAVTVDHGLRTEAADEARAVARVAASLGIQHDTLHWTDPGGSGNLPQKARRGRYRLMADWGQRRGLAGVLLGHTADDVAETFLMRLQRHAGLSGLAAIREGVTFDGMVFRRPLLAARRDDLRVILAGQGLAWHDDPSNDDPRYGRTRARAALRVLADLDLDAGSLADVAAQLRGTEAGLRHLLADWCARNATWQAGEVRLEADALDALPDDPARRVMDAATVFVTGRDHPPRARDQLRLIADRPAKATLHGCLVTRDAGTVRIGREPAAALHAPEVALGVAWDGRWKVSGPRDPSLRVRALGDAGLARLPDWRLAGCARDTALAGPGVWRDGALIAAPTLRPDGAFDAAFCRDDFPSSLVSH